MNSNNNNNLVAFIGWHEGSAGLIHSWFEKTGDYKITCFIHADDNPPVITKITRSASQFSYPENSKFKGLPFICSSDWPQYLKSNGITKALITTPDSIERAQQIKLALEAGLELVNAIHPSVLIMEDAILGKNIIMHARSFLGYRAELKDGVILNTGAQVDHHCVLDKCVTIAPGVTMASNVHIEEKCTVHTAAVIKNKITIKKNSVIGAGTVVIRDVEENKVMVGVPARILKKNE